MRQIIILKLFLTDLPNLRIYIESLNIKGLAEKLEKCDFVGVFNLESFSKGYLTNVLDFDENILAEIEGIRIKFVPDEEFSINNLNVSYLDLDVSTYGCLHRSRIKTIGEVLALSDKELLKVCNNSKKHQVKILDALKSFTTNVYKFNE